MVTGGRDLRNRVRGWVLKTGALLHGYAGTLMLSFRVMLGTFSHFLWGAAAVLLPIERGYDIG